MTPKTHLGRAGIASHLQLSLRSVDRFLDRHGLRSAPGRHVLVRLESYAWCLVGLRHQSTHSMAPAMRPGMPAPVPFQPGEELITLTAGDGSVLCQEALQQLAPGCTIRTLDECPPGHWVWSVFEATEAMVEALTAMEPGAARPTPAGNPTAARYLRGYLHEAHAYGGQPLDGEVLARMLRHLSAGRRRLLLEALAGELVESARAESGAPLEYARRPVLTEHELASEVGRSVDTVRRWRVEGRGPVFLRVERAVRYSRVDLNQWLDIQRPTAQ